MILAIDIGGSSAKLALVDRNGKIGPRFTAETAFDEYRTPILDTVVRAAKAFLAREGTAVEGIGVSATGQIDTFTGTVIGTNGSIPNYEGAQIGETLRREFGCPTYVLNDANAAALGECFAGRARGLLQVLMVTFGTGVGGGIVLDGRIFGGARGIAGEIGLFPVPAEDGRYEWFEQRASTKALVRSAEEATGEAGLNGRIIFERLGRNDSRLQQTYDRWLDGIAAGLIGLTHIFNPEMIVIGGGISAQQALFVSPLKMRVLRGVQPRFAEGLRIEPALLGNDAGLAGAAKYFMDRRS